MIFTLESKENQDFLSTIASLNGWQRTLLIDSLELSTNINPGFRYYLEDHMNVRYLYRFLGILSLIVLSGVAFAQTGDLALQIVRAGAGLVEARALEIGQAVGAEPDRMSRTMDAASLEIASRSSAPKSRSETSARTRSVSFAR